MSRPPAIATPERRAVLGEAAILSPDGGPLPALGREDAYAYVRTTHSGYAALLAAGQLPGRDRKWVARNYVLWTLILRAMDEVGAAASRRGA